MKHEFLLTEINTRQQVYNSVCPPKQFAGRLRGGFGGTRECVCETNRPTVNCAGSGYLKDVPYRTFSADKVRTPYRIYDRITNACPIGVSLCTQ